IVAGGSVTFQGACVDPDGDGVTHRWTFGGAAADSTAQSPGAVVFASGGSFTVTYTCTDSRGLADPTPDTRTITAATNARSLGGTITFDKVTSTVNGLDYNAIVQRPVRGAEVSLVDAANTASVLATAVTGNDGKYSLVWPNTGPTSVKVVLFARTASPKITVQDNTSSGAVYAVASGTIDATTTSTVDLNAPSGWNGSGYTSRTSGPLAVLDAATEAVLAFRVVRPAVAFADLQINWSANNAPVGPQGTETQEQAYAAGHIGTSHWNGSALYILGKADVDTDEFDDHVIVHEWGHYFESTLSRSDNPGGPHGAGDIKDARLAFGEGWGNALSAMVWSPRTAYTDSSGPQQGQGFGFDLEDNSASDPFPGWYSEGSVQSILYDLFDSGSAEAFDTVALGLGPIYDAMTGGEKNTTAMTTLFSFISALKAANPAQSAAIDTLTRYRNVVQVPIADAYGTGETNNGGNAANLPLYRTIGVGTGVTVTLANTSGQQNPNDLSQNRYFRFTGNGAPHTVSISTGSANDVDVVVFQKGAVQAFANGPTGTETTGSFNAANGVEYIIVVTGFGASASYTTTVTVN
ncbi:MAG: PKD domain-containing protein, partial [Myxococcales bacterium]